MVSLIHHINNNETDIKNILVDNSADGVGIVNILFKCGKKLSIPFDITYSLYEIDNKINEYLEHYFLIKERKEKIEKCLKKM